MMNKLKALVFDCDGVLAETERDGHRIAFNRTFAARGYDFTWDEALYKELVKIGGGKERMKHFFDRTSWPAGTSDKDALVKELHKLKTDYYTRIIESGELPLRPGVARLVDEAVAAGRQARRLLDLQREGGPYGGGETARSRAESEVRRDPGRRCRVEEEARPGDLHARAGPAASETDAVRGGRGQSQRSARRQRGGACTAS